MIRNCVDASFTSRGILRVRRDDSLLSLAAICRFNLMDAVSTNRASAGCRTSECSPREFTERATMSDSSLDILWVLTSAGLVFTMQVGFLCLESGLTRGKNAINVGLKNLTDFSGSLLLFWAFGFALVYGSSESGLIGWGPTCLPLHGRPAGLATFFLFQAVFCSAAVAIVSGAVAERTRFSGCLVVTLVVSGLVYPIFGHWAWGGVIADGRGWLASLGFVDFAGSTVVHGVGAWCALAAVLMVGPRTGRFETGKPPLGLASCNLPLAVLGTMLLWLGWIGFDGGSTLAMDGQVPGIVCNTLLSGAAGMATGLALGWLVKGRPGVNLAIDGSLAGLVAITAGCHAVATASAVVIGAVGAIAMMGAQALLIRRRIDDVVGAVPVHGAAGAWGAIAVALFGLPERLGTGLSWWRQLLVQLTGVFAALVLCLTVMLPLLWLIRRVVPLRVSLKDERLGLNISEHGASTETFDLLVEMEAQRKHGDFLKKVTVPPFTEVGPIAAQYNEVLDRVTEESDRATHVTDQLREGGRQMRAIIDSSLDCVVAFDGQGCITEFNPAAEKVFGYRHQDVFGSPLLEIIFPQESHQELFAGLKHSDESGENETLFQSDDISAMRSDGTIFEAELSIVSSETQQGRVFTAFLRDVTEVRLADEEREAMQQRLIETSRQAGMAEVATGVLHNVGNVLNSVNVSADILGQKLQKSSVTSLAKASQVVAEHRDDLAEFLTEDSRGKHFPRLLEELAEGLLVERDEQMQELQSLTQNIEHIKEIVSMQQDFGCVSGSAEAHDMIHLLEDALKINDAGLHRHRVSVVREFADLPQVVTEKHKVLVILVNLISNAKYAVSPADQTDRVVTLSASVDSDTVCIEVRDNGIGIPQENLTSIFSHGFTTKKDGHGFGLHSSALAAQELGGSLSVHSDGHGTGATFTLRVPVEREVLCKS